jgi:hypothetical protein
MPCFYCGKRISMVRQMADQDFCSDEHRRRYQDLGDAILRRLSESDSRPAARAAAAKPAPPRAVVPRSAPKVAVPPQTGVIHERFPVPSGILSALAATLPDAAFAGPAPVIGSPPAGLPRRTAPEPFAILKTASPSCVAARTHAVSEPSLAFGNRPAVFGAFAPRRTSTSGPGSAGFFPMEPEARRRSARQRSVVVPRFANRRVLMPNVPEPPAAGVVGPAASGPIPPLCWPAAPLAAVPSAGLSEPLAPAPARLPVMRVVPSADSGATPAQPVTGGRVCEWRITLPRPASPPAARIAAPAPLALPVSSAVFPGLTHRRQHIREIQRAGLMPNTVPALPFAPGPVLTSGAACDSWPLPAGLRTPAPAAVGMARRADLPQAGVIRGQLPGPHAPATSPSAVPVLPFASCAVRTAAHLWCGSAAGMPAPGLYRQPMPLVRKRPSESRDLLRPPILTVVPVLPDITAEATWRPCSQFGFRVSVPAVTGAMTAGRRAASESPLPVPAPSWPPLTVPTAQRALPRATHLTVPDFGFRPIPATPLPANPVITASPLRILSHAVRSELRALPPAEPLPVAPRVMRSISRRLPAAEPPMSRPAALPAVRSGVCSSTPAAAPPWALVLRPQAGTLGPRLFAFAETTFGAPLPPRFIEGIGQPTIEVAGLADWFRAVVHGASPSFASAVPAAGLAAPPLRIPPSDSPARLQVLPPLGVTPLSAPLKPGTTTPAAWRVWRSSG